MDSDLVAAALGSADTESSLKESPKPSPPFQNITGNQVKLELEVTLTPEIVASDSTVTSTVNTNSNGSSLTVTPSVSKTVTTVIPPTTIVCLPSAVTTAPMMNSTVNEVAHCATIPRPGKICTF